MKTKSTKLPAKVQRRINEYNANQALVDKLIDTFTNDESICRRSPDGRAVYALGYLGGLMATMLSDATPAAKKAMVDKLEDRIRYRTERLAK
jgi:hypothetical protein